jgi:hypothetical protein
VSTQHPDREPEKPAYEFVRLSMDDVDALILNLRLHTRRVHIENVRLTEEHREKL